MIGFVLRWWKPLSALAVVVLVWAHGYTTGSNRCETAHALASAASEKARAAALSDLAAAEQRNRLMALELEDAARAEPVQSPACLSADRVRRLNLR